MGFSLITLRPVWAVFQDLALTNGLRRGVGGMHLLMPWFLPLAAGSACLLSRTALSVFHERKPKQLDGLLLLALAWFPLMIWVFAQFASPASRQP